MLSYRGMRPLIFTKKSPDILPHRKEYKKAAIQFSSPATLKTAIPRSEQAAQEHFEKSGVIEYMRVVEVTAERVVYEALVVVVV